MKILITGASGFVGKALCGRAMSEGWMVNGAIRADKQAVLPPGVNALNTGPIGPDTDWSEAVAGVGAVIHLAARVHVMNDAATDPLAEFRLINVAGTERLARTAASAGVRRFIYLSSVKVNGEGGNRPYSEHDLPAPADPYGVSKHEAEIVLREIEKETGLEAVIIRPPLVYGPGVKANFLRMIEAVDRGIPLPLGSISNRRSLVYLGNLVDAIVTCVSHPGAAGQTYLVSDSDDVSTPELVRRVAAALGRSARLFPFPAAVMRFAGRLAGKPDAVERLLGSLAVDISKIRRELGWKPPCTMEQGLKETARWFKGTFRA